MLSIGLTLEVGNLVNGKFKFHDSFDMEIFGDKKHEVDSVNDILHNSSTDGADYAQLLFTYSTDVKTYTKLVGSFRRKGSAWLLTE